MSSSFLILGDGHEKKIELWYQQPSRAATIQTLAKL